jgi:hypothetical protein
MKCTFFMVTLVFILPMFTFLTRLEAQEDNDA